MTTDSKVSHSRRSLNIKDLMCMILKYPAHVFPNMLGFEGRESQTPLYISLRSIVSSPHFLLPQCTSFTAEHRDGASQGGRRRRRRRGRWWGWGWGRQGGVREGQMKRELNARVRRGIRWEAWWREKPKRNKERIKV